MKKIYLLPNFITMCNLLCGYWSITFALKGFFTQAAIMIFFSMLFDSIDGKVARITNTTSRFGLEFDSLADLISFGAAPACIIYQMFAGDAEGEKLAWWGSFIFIVCGALRLARYNVQSSNEEKVDFTGLPIPCAAGTVAAFVLFALKHGYNVSHQIVIFLVIPLGLLMVSTVRYSSMQFAFQGKKALEFLVAAVVIIGLLVRYPQEMLLFIFGSYIVIGLILAIKDRIFKKDSFQNDEEF